MSKLRRTTIADVGAVVRESDPRPIFLIGAGASVTSGVDLADNLAQLIVRWEYCRLHALDLDDPSLGRSDWMPWLRSMPWFDPDESWADAYPTVVRHILTPREKRRRFFLEHVVKPPDAASSGYRDLADLVGKRRVHTILTTNFDTLAVDACRADPSSAAVRHVRSPADATLISSDPSIGQIVHVHGTVENYSDQNLEEEIADLDRSYRDSLLTLIRDHPLIVVGYRGAEPSIMEGLLGEAVRQSDQRLPHGVFWCGRVRDGDVHPLVMELASECGANFALVPIEGFDELMGELNDGVTRSDVTGAQSPPVFYDAVQSTEDLGQMDSSLIRSELNTQALERLGFSGWDEADPADVLEALGLKDAGQPLVNHAARILFSTTPTVDVNVTTTDGHTHVSGNLYAVYGEVLELLTMINQPYRLKGPESTEVRPYPPLALKELLVNALAHRSYEADSPIGIRVEPEDLTIESPGGLIDPSLAPALGERPVRAYRNPGLAEALYASGHMDKAGSGLTDVAEWVAAGGGAAEFGTRNDNTAFYATITARPDAPDDGGPATPPGGYEVYHLNALPTVLPASVYIGQTTFKKPRDLFEANKGVRLAAFHWQSQMIYTFADLRDPSNPLSDCVEAVEELAVAELEGSEEGRRILVELLNRCMASHLKALGMVVYQRDQRAWYPTNEESGDERKITYVGRVRRATRTVARARTNRKGETWSFEHPAFVWQFIRDGDGWLLLLQPTWVYTVAGNWKLINRQKLGRHVTRKMSNERNRAVLAHLYFWTAMICREQPSIALDDGTACVSVLASPLAHHLAGQPEVTGSGEALDPDPDDLEDIDDEPDEEEP